ncbi:MAG: HAMP domain-containing sensor histidine kinase [Candidatus Binatia bacterium]|nr:HAMP domain-containing sensor histidine kinase [Candidatus Binatia bacterium]
MSDPSLEARRELFIEGLLVRSALAGVFSFVAMIFAVFRLAPTTSTYPALAILAGLATINVPYWFVGKARRFPLSDFFPHWLVDILFLTVLIHYIGGADAPYATIMYYSLVLFAAVSESRRVAMRLAAASMLSFGTLVFLENIGVLAPVELWDHHLSAAAQVLAFGVSTAFILALAFVGGTLADHLKQSNAELRSAAAIAEEHNLELERRVAERTAELAAATQEIADLVHIVSHDLKNVAVGATETARQLATKEKDRLSDRGQVYVRHLLEDSRTLSRMLEDLLRLFRATDPSIETREWVDVDDIVRRVVRRLGPQMEQKNIEIRIGTMPRVFADHSKIRHIFDNLIDNACKYIGDEEAPRIEVEGMHLDGEVEYFVRDNGIGISERQRERVFQLYHRVPEPGATTGGPDGHGVGLAIVKRIVERYGGRIEVESALGQGSTFRVCLPGRDEASA